MLNLKELKAIITLLVAIGILESVTPTVTPVHPIVTGIQIPSRVRLSFASTGSKTSIPPPPPTGKPGIVSVSFAIASTSRITVTPSQPGTVYVAFAAAKK